MANGQEKAARQRARRQICNEKKSSRLVHTNTHTLTEKNSRECIRSACAHSKNLPAFIHSSAGASTPIHAEAAPWVLLHRQKTRAGAARSCLLCLLGSCSLACLAATWRMTVTAPRHMCVCVSEAASQSAGVCAYPSKDLCAHKTCGPLGPHSMRTKCGRWRHMARATSDRLQRASINFEIDICSAYIFPFEKSG